MQFDHAGLMTRENVWPDYLAVTAQLTDDPSDNHTNEHQYRAASQWPTST